MVMTKMDSGAVFSEDRIYRYLLWRIWASNGGMVTFICLNPSVADETTDDPTVRRCAGYAKAWGYGGMYVVNLFPLRSTNPEKLREIVPLRGVSLENEEHISWAVQHSLKAIAAWGNHGLLRNAGQKTYRMLYCSGLGHRLFCLGMTKKKQPTHPLYLRKDAKPIPFVP